MAPEALPADIDTVIVALNPRIARQAVEGVEAWSDRSLNFCYLDEARRPVTTEGAGHMP